MIQQMCWLPISKTDETKMLYLRVDSNQTWQPYTAFPEYAIPDHPVPGSSKGYATYQQLRHQGWLLISA